MKKLKISLEARPTIFFAGLLIFFTSIAFYILALEVDIAKNICNYGITVSLIVMACSLDAHLIVLTLIFLSVTTTGGFTFIETNDPELQKMLYLLAALLVAIASYARQLLSKKLIQQ